MSAPALPRARRRARRPNWTARLRRISQATFAVLILAMSLRHIFAEASGLTEQSPAGLRSLQLIPPSGHHGDMRLAMEPPNAQA